MIDNQTNRREFRQCVEAMFVSLGGEFSDAALLGYWIALGDMELKQLQQACYRAMRECRHVPRPAELREFVFGKPEDQSLIAWTDAIKHTPMGCWKHVDFEDRVINATIRSLGGWPAFLERLTPSDEKFVRAQFIKTYASFLASGVSGEICQPLPGLSQAEVVDGQVVDPRPRRLRCNSVANTARLESSRQERLEVEHAT